jgi:hexosaminidase
VKSRARLLAAIAILASACGPHSVRIPPPPPAMPPPGPLHAVIPRPIEISFGEQPPFAITPDTVIVVPPGSERLRGLGRALSDLIGRSTGDAPPQVIADGGAQPPPAAIVLLRRGDARNADERYELTVTADRVTIEAAGEAGLFYGAQTLRLLLPPFLEFRGLTRDAARQVSIRPVHVVDAPRFEWRGAMLDVARHFLTVQEVERYIDLIALYKLNRLHLHLADDQGWRIEIRSRPRLTAYGATTQVGGGAGGFYTQQQYSQIVDYAASRFVTIVPEIDMPGHTTAALASYAELNCDGQAPPLFTGTRVGFSALCVDRETTYTFIDDVVGEIAALSPGAYFHIGGDEVRTLTPEQYARFIARVQAIVERHGKRMIGWDEIAAADLHPSTLAQHWRPRESPAAALARGVRVIMSIGSRTYLDMKYNAATPIGLNWAGYIEARDAYEWDPAAIVPAAPPEAIVGVEAPLWTETVTSIRDVEFLAFPRIAEVAEVAWTPAASRRWDEFRMRLGAQAPRWTALGVNFYRSAQVPWQRAFF